MLCGISFYVALGGHTLWDVDEPNNAVCAREMLAAGNWWVPTFNGDLRFDKPILLYWIMMPLYALFGISEWTARLPSALAMTGLVFTIWYFIRRLIDRGAAFTAAMLFASAIHIVVIGRAAVPDPLLMLCLAIALFGLLTVYIERNREGQYLLVVSYVAIGLGVLAKGPVAVVMPVLILTSFLLLQGEWSRWRLFRPWLGLSVAALVALPWYVTVGLLTEGEWLKGFLFHHNLERFTDTLQGHGGFPGMYVLSFILGWFPWSMLLIYASISGAWRLQALRQQPMRLFLLCWMGAFLVFFTLARTQLPNYTLPAFPAAAALMALWIHQSDAAVQKKAWRGLVWVIPALGLLFTIGGGFAIQRMWPGEWFYSLVFLPGSVVVAWWLRRKPEDTVAPILAGMLMLVVLLVGWSIPGIDHHKVTKEMAAKATDAGFGSQALATFRYFQPSLLFYHGGRLPHLGTATEVGSWLFQGKAVVMPKDALVELPSEMQSYFVVHHRVQGLYARKTLLLLSLQPVEEMVWPKN